MTTARPVQFQSGAFSLEGVRYSPEPMPDNVVVVCHPHPQRGGDMHNNVVMTLARALVDLNMATLTFNFRGVGASEGVHDGGKGERDDVRAALDAARSQVALNEIPQGGMRVAKEWQSGRQPFETAA